MPAPLLKAAIFCLFLAAPAGEAAEQAFERTPNPWKLRVSEALPGGDAAAELHLTPAEALAVGRRLWRNEAGGKVTGLTHWNQGENFASLGIGHFIWYPLGMQGPFVESFPPMLAYLEARGVVLPEWLRGGVPCPWDTREEFYAHFKSSRMLELRRLLEATVAQQAEFAAARLSHALPVMLASLPEGRRAAVLAQFTRVARSPGGAYPLIDYVNFKGEGVSPTERYRGRGWGLLQVLVRMKGTETGPAALAAFADSAGALLRQRVRLSPARRHERRWLGVWLKRVRSYRGGPSAVPADEPFVVPAAGWGGGGAAAP